MVTLALLQASCATLAVRDTYQAVANAELLLYRHEDIRWWLRLEPKLQFASAGLLGVPIIPMYARLREARTITLSASLVVYSERAVSFAPRPCLLAAEGAAELCPVLVEISANAMYRDDGSMYKDKRPRWNRIPEFKNLSKLTLEPSTETPIERIDRSMIDRFYGYSGTPKFGYFAVDLRYVYECPQACPAELTLDTTDLVAIDELSIAAGPVKFERRTETNYRAIEPGLQ
ncbi:MAG: hypothetical protein AB7G13_20755 [Lautropia sp.]